MVGNGVRQKAVKKFKYDEESKVFDQVKIKHKDKALRRALRAENDENILMDNELNNEEIEL